MQLENGRETKMQKKKRKRKVKQKRRKVKQGLVHEKSVSNSALGLLNGHGILPIYENLLL